jgi:hypothetical protein
MGFNSVLKGLIKGILVYEVKQPRVKQMSLKRLDEKDSSDMAINLVTDLKTVN